MNQLTIFYQLSFLYFLYVPTQADPIKVPVWQIKEAKVDPGPGAESLVFNEGEVHLYKIINEGPGGVNYYVVGDNTNKECPKFPLTRESTIVTSADITIRWFDQTFVLILFEGRDTFAFYRRFFAHWSFIHEFSVVEFIQDDVVLEDVSMIKAKKGEDGEWVFGALKGNKPHMIFPKMYSQGSLKEHADDEVLVTIDTKPETTIIDIKFINSSNANAFYRYLNTGY